MLKTWIVSTRIPTIDVLSKNIKNIKILPTAENNLCILHGHFRNAKVPHLPMSGIYDKKHVQICTIFRHFKLFTIIQMIAILFHNLTLSPI